MKIKITVSDFGKTTYVIIFLLFIVFFYFILRCVFMYEDKSEKEDEKEGEEEENEEEEREKERKKKKSDEEEFFSTSNSKILVLYASQTGTAEEFSVTFEEDSKKYGFNVLVQSIYDYEKTWSLVTSGEIDVVAFLLATYGEGEPTDSAREFHIALQKSREDLSKVTYVMFGLGNLQYCKRYQQFARETQTKLKKLGASMLGEMGEGDSDKYIEDDFDGWRDTTLEILGKKFGKSKSKESENEAPQPKYKLIWIDEEPDSIPPPFNRPRVRPNQKTPFLSTVKSRKELIVDDSTRSTFHMELDVKKSRIRYMAGDHLGVLPENNGELISQYVKRLGLEDSMGRCISLILLKNPVKGNRYLKKTSLANVFKFYLDLTASPKRKSIRMMAEFAEDEKDKLALLQLYTQREKFNADVVDAHKRVIDILQEFESVKLPLHVFLEITPILQPRFYSIASSPNVDKEMIDLCVAKFLYKTSTGREGVGVCSGYLADIPLGNTAYCWVRESKFHLPKNPKVPIIWIANGTGFAPLRGFVQERRFLKEEKGAELGDCVLFFGCRNKKVDWLYSEEMTAAQQDGIVTSLHLAFSRDQKEKVYVQHLVKQQKESIVKAVHNGAYIYVCGSTDMANEVNGIISEMLVENVKELKNSDEVDEYLEERYFCDAWSV